MYRRCFICPNGLRVIMMDLPVERILETLRITLRKGGCAVLQAPPGAGKTTRVPLALLTEPWMADKRLLMLEPRRLAARAAAARLAANLGQSVGETVGYRMRMEQCVGHRTRIEVLTEGVLTRMLQTDPALDGVGLVIFDECHERNLTADLALALCMDIQGVLNESLRLLAMSATLDSRPLAQLMGNAPVITCTGKEFPVTTHYVGRGNGPSIAPHVAETIRMAIKRYDGSILVFLPGAPEIRNVQHLLDRSDLGPGCRVVPLYGHLTRQQQQHAIEPPPAGCRKIVLATPIAETSLTIEGIGVVVDSGYRRAPSFDVASGMTRLITLPVSRASADQRSGRAGRLGPGDCLRLWDQNTHHLLAAHNRPEILETDLTPLALELAVWGVNDPEQLKWLDSPPKAAFKKGQHLLDDLGALSVQDKKSTDVSAVGTVTTHGRRMAELAMHPRLAHMVLMAREAGAGALACRVAAILGERDFIRFAPGTYDSDLRLRLDVLETVQAGQRWADPAVQIDYTACRRIRQAAEMFQKRLHMTGKDTTETRVGKLLAWAYPERIARRRPGTRGRYLMVNGGGAYFNSPEPLSAEEYLVAAALDGNRREARIFLSAGYDETDLKTQYGHRVEETTRVEWDPRAGAVKAETVCKLGALTLTTEPFTQAPPQRVIQAMAAGIRSQGLDCLPWTRTLHTWQARVLFLRRLDAGRSDWPDGCQPNWPDGCQPNWPDGCQPNWPDVSDDTLCDTLEKWLTPYLQGINRLKKLQGIDLKGALHTHLTWRQHRLLDELAPTHYIVPSGAHTPIDYRLDPPVLAVRIQQLFGASSTPAIGGGMQPLVLHLLSPAGRPMQITQDLAGFWANSYHEVKKSLKARYPKHEWPDDPLHARPTDRAKPRSSKKKVGPQTK
jgi:ATP-dependent RNA helicase HrpB